MEDRLSIARFKQILQSNFDNGDEPHLVEELMKNVFSGKTEITSMTESGET